MKRTLSLFLISIICFACGEADQQGLSVKTKEISLYPKGRVQIDAISGYNMIFRSVNDYQATVSVNGLVTAQKVGETVIELMSDDRVVKIPVEVKGRFNLYTDPILDWGITSSELIAKLGEPDYSPSKTIIEYHDYSDQAPKLIYLFGSNEKLVNVLIDVLGAYSEDLYSHLEERFVFDSKDEYLSVYCNSHKEEDVTLLIGVFDMGKNGCLVSYIEYNNAMKSNRPVRSYIEQLRGEFEAIDLSCFKIKTKH